jgi:hypothetical protein
LRRRLDRCLRYFDRRVDHLDLRPSRFDPRVCGCHLRPRGEVILRRVIEVLLRNIRLFGEREITIHIELRMTLICLSQY